MPSGLSQHEPSSWLQLVQNLLDFIAQLLRLFS
jgi:hypothetical protein